MLEVQALQTGVRKQVLVNQTGFSLTECGHDKKLTGESWKLCLCWPGTIYRRVVCIKAAAYVQFFKFLVQLSLDKVRFPTWKSAQHAELVTHSGGTLLTSYKLFLAKWSSEKLRSLCEKQFVRSRKCSTTRKYSTFRQTASTGMWRPPLGGSY